MTTGLHHPDPSDQFYRLSWTGSRWVKTTRWNNVIGGHNFDGENCTPTEATVLYNAEGLGHASPGFFRAAAGDHSGGMNINQIASVFRSRFGRTILVPAGYGWLDLLQTLKRDHRHISLGVDYGLIPYAYQIQKGGSFAHQLGIDDIRADGSILLYDPLGTAARWVPQSAVRGAAEHIARRFRGTSGSLFVGLGRRRSAAATTAVARYKAVVPGPDTAFFEYHLANGVIRAQPFGRTGARTGGFSASCTAPRIYSWPSLGRRVSLVKLTSGARKDHYIEAKFAHPLALLTLGTGEEVPVVNPHPDLSLDVDDNTFDPNGEIEDDPDAQREEALDSPKLPLVAETAPADPGPADLGPEGDEPADMLHAPQEED